ncbi:hypothetical protein [Mycoplasmopsis fermentans]|nr:hypothetical protein [Mycoplasmopsis fermentans]RMX35420.1 hypothetical protein MFI1_0471 [Mycoplasmopsis fermentans MF-I1]
MNEKLKYISIIKIFNNDNTLKITEFFGDNKNKKEYERIFNTSAEKIDKLHEDACFVFDYIRFNVFNSKYDEEKIFERIKNEEKFVKFKKQNVNRFLRDFFNRICKHEMVFKSFYNIRFLLVSDTFEIHYYYGNNTSPSYKNIDLEFNFKIMGYLWNFAYTCQMEDLNFKSDKTIDYFKEKFLNRLPKALVKYFVSKIDRNYLDYFQEYLDENEIKNIQYLTENKEKANAIIQLKNNYIEIPFLYNLFQQMEQNQKNKYWNAFAASIRTILSYICKITTLGFYLKEDISLVRGNYQKIDKLYEEMKNIVNSFEIKDKNEKGLTVYLKVLMDKNKDIQHNNIKNIGGKLFKYSDIDNGRWYNENLFLLLKESILNNKKYESEIEERKNQSIFLNDYIHNPIKFYDFERLSYRLDNKGIFNSTLEFFQSVDTGKLKEFWNKVLEKWNEIKNKK